MISMDSFFTIRVISAVVIAFIYMLFDVFNKRNVPEKFAYATLVFGFIFTLISFDQSTIISSVTIAAIVLGLGYLVYKFGEIGAADVIEFVALSLLIPTQTAPFLIGRANQFGLPFVVSLIVSTGIVSLVIVPLYYLPRARRLLKRPLIYFITDKDLFKSTILSISYLAFTLFIILLLGINPVGLLLLVIMMINSAIIILFERPITDSMVELVSVEKFEAGDIIAFNLMNEEEIKRLKISVKNFDRLITQEVIDEMKRKKIKTKIPVYKQAMPLALSIFIALVLSLLFGNIILFILPLK